MKASPDWDWLALLDVWLSFGLDDDAFWRKSPRQIVAILKGREAALVREHNDRAWLAYYTAFLPRVKKPMPLRRLQVRQDRARRQVQSWQQMKAVAQMITLAFGGEVVRRDAADAALLGTPTPDPSPPSEASLRPGGGESKR